MPPENFRDLMRLAHGFESAKLLLVANDLDLFQKVGEGCTAAELAASLQVDSRALELVLNALVALGLLTSDEGLYRKTSVSQEFLAGENYRGHIFRHIHHCWESWNDLAGVLKRGGPLQVQESSILHDQESWNRDFIRGMEDVTRDLAPQVVAQLALDGAKRLLDVGGGPGTYARVFLESHPSLGEVAIFDLPMALNVARERLAGCSVEPQVKLVAGDFTRDDFGEGFDAVWISQVFHSQDESGCRMLIDKAWSALNPGGWLMIHEFLLDDNKAAPLTAALFAVHMLVMTQGGRAYSGKEVSGWLGTKGFDEISVQKVSDDTGVVIGRKS